MSLEQAFLADIIENPDDDLPRLAYGDWLQDYGEEADRARGEFIHLQCIDASRGEDMTLRERIDVSCRIQELLRLHSFPHWIPPSCRDLETQFRRGFLEHITCDTRLPAARMTRILREAPTCKSLRIKSTDLPSELEDMMENGFSPLRSSLISRIRELRLHSIDMDGLVARHLSRMRLDAMRVLICTDMEFRDDSLRVLLTNHDGFPALEHLELDMDDLLEEYKPYAPRELRSFTREPATTLPSLRTLHLRGALHGIGRETLRLLRRMMRQRGGELIARKSRKEKAPTTRMLS